MGQVIRRREVEGFGIEKLEVVDFRGEIVEVVNVPMKYDYEEAKKIMEVNM